MKYVKISAEIFPWMYINGSKLINCSGLHATCQLFGNELNSHVNVCLRVRIRREYPIFVIFTINKLIKYYSGTKILNSINMCSPNKCITSGKHILIDFSGIFFYMTSRVKFSDSVHIIFELSRFHQHNSNKQTDNLIFQTSIYLTICIINFILHDVVQEFVPLNINFLDQKERTCFSNLQPSLYL